MSFVDDVAAKAQGFKAARFVLTLLALPFFLVGVVVGLAWVALSWAWAAVQVGMIEARGAARSGDG